MTAKKNTRIPSLRKCNGRGFVELNGKRHYLGQWGKPETKQAYERTISVWLANGKRTLATSTETRVVDLCLAYLLHCEEYFQKPDGTHTSSLLRVKQSIRAIKNLYGDVSVSEFGPNSLRAVRDRWIENGLARKTINDYTADIKRMFKWGTSMELVPAWTYQALYSLDSLRMGRSSAKETSPVKPVPEMHVIAVKPFVSKQVWALIQLQLFTGARAGELLGLRSVDLDTSTNVWMTRLKDHKTAYIGKQRVIYLGPRSQEILKSFMESRPISQCIFSPNEALQDVNHGNSTSRANECYSPDSYRRSIERACTKAKVPAWTPHRLRHNAATTFRAEFGLEAAQVMLGHQKASVTEIYAEKSEQLALEIASKIG